MSNEEPLKQYDVKKYRTPDGYTTDIAVSRFLQLNKRKLNPEVLNLDLAFDHAQIIEDGIGVVQKKLDNKMELMTDIQ